MQGRVRVVSSCLGAIVALAFGAHAVEAQVVPDKDQRKCIETLAKEGGKYVKARLKELTKCADKNLKATATCDVAKRDLKLDKAETGLRTKIDKACGDASKLPIPDLALKLLGFPGKCEDTTGSPFTNDDLEECMFTSHRDAADALFALQYGSNGDVDTPNTVDSFEDQGHDADTAKRLQKCQKEIGKNGLKFVQTILKEIQKCRNGLQKGALTGFLPTECADNAVETKPKEKIDKAETKVRDKITGKCSTGELPLLDVCDTGGGAETAIGPALDCLVDTHRNASDNPNPAAPADLIDYEYRASATCGDSIKNDRPPVSFGSFFIADPLEECDGTDDDDCPGLCGAPDSQFPCMCTNVKRVRVVERAGLDGDNGWNGVSHDQGIPPNGGHQVGLYDCDGPGGPDTICTVGPSCSGAPHYPCVFPTPTVGQIGFVPALEGDAACAAHGQGTCRKLATEVGPHCNSDPKKSCTTNANCPSGDFCRKTLAQAPIPTSAGGVTVCTMNVLIEDVVGTLDVATGASSVRLRQNAKTLISAAPEPCPLCGGFCANAVADPALRTPCGADSDCPASVACVTSNICSFGPRADLECRPDPPYGSSTSLGPGTHLFGSTSSDCPYTPGGELDLDIATDPRTTGSVTMLPTATCDAFSFGNKACIVGANTGKICTADSQCDGSVGSCAPRCFCPLPPGSFAQKPNDCSNACRGGSNDYGACNADSDCPGGFCQEAACRLAQGVCLTGTNRLGTCAADSDCPGATPGQACGDSDSGQEGFCPQRPALDTFCSITTFRQCGGNDLACRPPSVGGTCTFCKPTEVCLTKSRDCFVNEGITRTGALGVTPLPGADLARRRVAVFCIPKSTLAVDSGGGFPGPGTTAGEEDLYLTGF